MDFNALVQYFIAREVQVAYNNKTTWAHGVRAFYSLGGVQFLQDCLFVTPDDKAMTFSYLYKNLT